MARFFHMPAPQQRVREERHSPSAPAVLLLLALAVLAAMWIEFPPVASLLPAHPPG